MKKIVIFGAGEWGKIAYHYYKENCEIVCYIDNDETLWNTAVNGIIVTSPDILKENEYTVIIANKWFEEEIKEQLLEDYNICGAVSFRINEEMVELYHKNSNFLCNEEIIIGFSWGLGNQMFQYALYRNYLKQGKNVKADLSAYIKPDMMAFELCSVFPGIKLRHCEPGKKELYLKKKGEDLYVEKPPKGKERRNYNDELLRRKRGYISGYHCSYKYPRLIRQELLLDFSFSSQMEEALCQLSKDFEQKEIVGIHVRRGDFLSTKYKREMGNICTDEYYKKAVDYIKEKRPDSVFCFFSNDINWVKKNMKEKNAIYIESNMFCQYQDWYDMYLMSICKHNIIPNSTFGWWGAWLNKNPDKIVIAPKRWRNRWDADDWCPPEWILF